jgi:hypothetical protein
MIPPMGMPNFSAPPPVGLVMPPVSMGMQMPGNSMLDRFCNSIYLTLGQQAQPQMDHSEIIFRARANIFRRDLNGIHSIPDLMKYSNFFCFFNLRTKTFNSSVESRIRSYSGR